jgi:hypothetical protein
MRIDWSRAFALIVVAIAAFGVALALYRPSGLPMAYTTFLAQVGAGHIRDYVQTGNTLQATMSDGGLATVDVPPTAIVADDIITALGNPPAAGLGGATVPAAIPLDRVMAGVLPAAFLAGLGLWFRGLRHHRPPAPRTELTTSA